MNGFLCCLYESWIPLILEEQNLCHNVGPFLLLYCYIQSYKDDKLSVRMDAFLVCIQFLYTTHMEKASFLAEWVPLSFVYSFYIQLI